LYFYVVLQLLRVMLEEFFICGLQTRLNVVVKLQNVEKYLCLERAGFQMQTIFD
jgi:hypothetical protein